MKHHRGEPFDTMPYGIEDPLEFPGHYRRPRHHRDRTDHAPAMLGWTLLLSTFLAGVVLGVALAHFFGYSGGH